MHAEENRCSVRACRRQSCPWVERGREPALRGAGGCRCLGHVRPRNDVARVCDPVGPGGADRSGGTVCAGPSRLRSPNRFTSEARAGKSAVRLCESVCAGVAGETEISPVLERHDTLLACGSRAGVDPFAANLVKDVRGEIRRVPHVDRDRRRGPRADGRDADAADVDLVMRRRSGSATRGAGYRLAFGRCWMPPGHCRGGQHQPKHAHGRDADRPGASPTKHRPAFHRLDRDVRRRRLAVHG
jgi:hypothetical protein